MAREVASVMTVDALLAVCDRQMRGSATAAASATAGKKSGNPFPPAPSAFITAKPCGSSYDAKTTTVTPAFGHGYPAKVPYEVCGYQPSQFRSAYNVGSATGKGETVAIIDAYGSSTIAGDSSSAGTSTGCAR